MWWRPILYGILMWGVTIYAFRRGGWEERLCATACVASSYLTLVMLNPHYEIRYQDVEYGVVLVDLCYFLIIACIAMASRKFWPLWLGAITGVAIMGHLLPHVPGGTPFLYQNAISLWSYPGWIIIALAVREHSLSQSAKTDQESLSKNKVPGVKTARARDARG
jgi:hypothetical protein